MDSHLSNDDFFSQLESLFKEQQSKGHGSVFITQKRVTHEQPSLSPSQTYPIIVRATNGKSKRSSTSKTKLSTLVEPAHVEAFFARQGEICKAGMTAMKPRDRKKQKAKAKKKKTGAGPS